MTAGMHAYCIDYTGLGIIELTEHAEPEIVGYTSINRSAVGIPAGVYLLRVESGEGVWTSKVARVR